MSLPVRSTTGDVLTVWDATFDASGTAVSNDFDAGADDNRYLIVWIIWHGASGHTMPDAGVTYNGLALTAYGPTLSSGGLRMRVYRRLAPTTGNHALVVDPTSGVAPANAIIAAACYSNVDQVAPYGTYSTTGPVTDSVAPLTVTSTGVAAVDHKLVTLAHGAFISGTLSGVTFDATATKRNLSNELNSNVGVIVGDRPGGDVGIATASTWAGATSIVAAGVSIDLNGIVEGPTINSRSFGGHAHPAPAELAHTDSVSATTSGGAMTTTLMMSSTEGGVYAAVEAGAGWVQNSSSSWTYTPPSNASLDGYWFKWACTDDNGTVETTAQQLRVYETTESVSTPETEDDGIGAGTITTDRPYVLPNYSPGPGRLMRYRLEASGVTLNDRVYCASKNS